jgi:large subunit ribosomal protein L7Ae
MSKSFFIKFKTPKEVVKATYEALQIASKTGKVRRGTNETTKAIERGKAILVAIAEDVDPPEVVAHIPIICEERKIPYVFVPSKAMLGSSTGIDIQSAAVCVYQAGESSDLVKEIIERINRIKEGTTNE